MSLFLKRATLLIIVVFTLLFFGENLNKTFYFLQNKYFPCKKTISYSIGTFDEQFALSKEKFIAILKLAESAWEEPVGLDLFSYVEQEGVLKINLLYDTRQDTTLKLKNIGEAVNSGKTVYEEMLKGYNILQQEYKLLRIEFDSTSLALKARLNTYQKEVDYFNSLGGANKKDYDRLNTERLHLDTDFAAQKILESKVNAKAAEINALVPKLKELAQTLNIEVRKFNTTGNELGDEFEEGNYIEDSLKKEINVYQFESEGKLSRVLAHELGHVLGLGHLDNPKAVMYRLNNGMNEDLTIDDIQALKNRCGID